MTYVLLVGDRHDNNILIKKDGRLLHIDFGFVFGENAKPFSPPVKLRKGMLSFLGDTQTGLNKAHSKKTFVVSAEQPLASPPIIPPKNVASARLLKTGFKTNIKTATTPAQINESVILLLILLPERVELPLAILLN